LEELNTLTDQILTTEQLHGKGHHDNLGPSTIDTSETIDVAGTECSLDFELGSMFHHGDSVVAVGLAHEFGIRQSLNGLFRLFQAALSYEPPWGGRSEPHDSEKRRDPDPLNNKGDSP
jgi:hypothetical protein